MCRFHPMRISGEGETTDLASEAALAEWVKAERVRRGWSQETLAKKVEAILGGGFPQSAVSKIEKQRGRRSITVDEAIALAQVFEVPLAKLLLPPSVARDEHLHRLLLNLADLNRRQSRIEENLRSNRQALLEVLSQAPALVPSLIKAVRESPSSKLASAAVSAFIPNETRRDLEDSCLWPEPPPGATEGDIVRLAAEDGEKHSERLADYHEQLADLFEAELKSQLESWARQKGAGHGQRNA